MALKAVVTPGCVFSNGFKDDLGSKLWYWRTLSVASNKTQKWNFVIRCQEDEKQSETGHDSQPLVDHSASNLSSLPSKFKYLLFD